MKVIIVYHLCLDLEDIAKRRLRKHEAQYDGCSCVASTGIHPQLGIP